MAARPSEEWFGTGSKIEGCGHPGAATEEKGNKNLSRHDSPKGSLDGRHMNSSVVGAWTF